METRLGNVPTPDSKQPGAPSRGTSPSSMEDDFEGIMPIPGLEVRRAACPSKSTSSRYILPVLAPQSVFPVNSETNKQGHKWVARVSYEIADRVRRWGMAFNGEAIDPWRFIEQVEEKSARYCIDGQQLAQAVANVLTGRAEDWFIVNTLCQVTWEQFKQKDMYFFLPP